MRAVNPGAVHVRALPLILRLRKHVLRSLDTGLKRAAQTPLRRDALDAVRRVDILDERDLVAGGAALAGGDGAVGEEELPDL